MDMARLPRKHIRDWFMLTPPVLRTQNRGRRPRSLLVAELSYGNGCLQRVVVYCQRFVMSAQYAGATSVANLTEVYP
jgi:hypothetical protein